MSTFRALAVIPVALLVLAACSDDNEKSADASAAVTTTLPATAVPGSTTTSPAAATTTAAAASTTVPDGPIQIDVLVGTDSSPTRIENVKLGSKVTINVTDPATADEFHLHGYDFEIAVDAGVTATFNFTANQAGEFELESHTTENVLMVLVVS